MNCPKCQHHKNSVLRTERLDQSNDRVRQCAACGHVFKAVEVTRVALYRVIKRVFNEWPICIKGPEFCVYLGGGGCKSSWCEVVRKKKDPLLCRAFFGVWK